MDSLIQIFSDPAAWAALITLVVMEVVLGIDNLLFISILTNKLPEHQRARARFMRHISPQKRNSVILNAPVLLPCSP